MSATAAAVLVALMAWTLLGGSRLSRLRRVPKATFWPVWTVGLTATVALGMWRHASDAFSTSQLVTAALSVAAYVAIALIWVGLSREVEELGRLREELRDLGDARRRTAAELNATSKRIAREDAELRRRLGEGLAGNG